MCSWHGFSHPKQMTLIQQHQLKYHVKVIYQRQILDTFTLGTMYSWFVNILVTVKYVIFS